MHVYEYHVFNHKPSIFQLLNYVNNGTWEASNPTKPTFTGPCPTGLAVIMKWRFGGLPSARVRVLYTNGFIDSASPPVSFGFLTSVILSCSNPKAKVIVNPLAILFASFWGLMFAELLKPSILKSWHSEKLDNLTRRFLLPRNFCPNKAGKMMEAFINCDCLTPAQRSSLRWLRPPNARQIPAGLPTKKATTIESDSTTVQIKNYTITITMTEYGLDSISLLRPFALG